MLNNAYQLNDFNKEINNWLGAAIEGSAIAQFNLGAIYANSNLEEHLPQAVQWFMDSAAQGYSPALFALTDLGMSATKDWSVVFGWYELAAARGYVFAQCRLGFCYYYGAGVAKSPLIAKHWYEVAAKQGYAAAQIKLGDFYESGKVVVQDYDEAIRWYKLAAAQGDVQAQRKLGEIYCHSHYVGRDYNKGLSLLILAAKQGAESAQISIDKLLGMVRLKTGFVGSDKELADLVQTLKI